MDIIIPCAGMSTRFPNMRPKYLLCDYQGRSMIQLAVDQYLTDHSVHIVILQKHEDEYNVTDQFRNMFGTLVDVIILPHLTQGPADTVYQALDKITFGNSQDFLVRDCDSIITHDRLHTGNKVFVDTLDNQPALNKPKNKSYVSSNDLGVINNIVEKEIISNTFCVGGYQFDNINKYKSAFNIIKENKSDEIYISSIIDYLLSKDTVFTIQSVNSYIDLGTLEDWEAYNNKPTIFCDIDGTLVVNQSLYGSNNYKDEAILLENNVKTLLASQCNGCQIIFTTSRPQKFHNETRWLLDSLGFGMCQLIMGLHHSRRIVVNDHAQTNPYPSAVAINLPRNSDTLASYLRGI